ncbi:hypothetical protein Cni_G24878 [Canna indica]|uniref:Uncharacterized protein n=1 Tax=Canna indica TaxID=4628 RepID=A0AAQ3QNX4_9LILI|nr:hypothetical protein Cni_G24878 [Canna indica]
MAAALAFSYTLELCRQLKPTQSGAGLTAPALGILEATMIAATTSNNKSTAGDICRRLIAGFLNWLLRY